MSSTSQTIHYDASQYRVYIPVYNFVCFCNRGPTKVAMARAALRVVLCAVYCILAIVLLRVPPLTFPSRHISFPPLAPPLLISLAPLLPPSSVASSLPSFPRSDHAYVISSLVPFLNHPSLPPLPLQSHHIIASSLPPLALSLPTLPFPPSLPSSILPRSFPASLPAYLPPSNSTDTICVFGKMHCIV